MAYWNWINRVYNYDEACKKIDELNNERSNYYTQNIKLKSQLAAYEECIKTLVEQDLFKGCPMPHEWMRMVYHFKEVLAKYKPLDS